MNLKKKLIQIIQLSSAKIFNDNRILYKMIPIKILQLQYFDRYGDPSSIGAIIKDTYFYRI